MESKTNMIGVKNKLSLTPFRFSWRKFQNLWFFARLHRITAGYPRHNRKQWRPRLDGGSMMARASILNLVLLCQCFWQLPAMADTAKVQIDKIGEYRLQGRTHDGNSIAVTIWVARGGSSIPYAIVLNDPVPPKTLITELKVEVKGKPLVVPLSVYADLFAPQEAFLQIVSSYTRLVITGGDASTSYKAVIMFGRGIVTAREIYSLLVPGKPTQRTVYWLRELKDE